MTLDLPMAADSRMAENIIQILADLPEFLRKSMIRSRLLEFYSMADPDKHVTVSASLEALPSLENVKLQQLIKTWLEILLEFEGSQITDIFRIYCEESLKNRLAIENLDIESLIDVFSSLQEWEKEKLADCLKEVIFSFPKRTEVLKIIPKPLLKLLKIENLYLSSGFLSGFFCNSPSDFSNPKNILSYLRSAFLCSDKDISSLISFITIT